jgi:hypothetical protein
VCFKCSDQIYAAIKGYPFAGLLLADVAIPTVRSVLAVTVMINLHRETSPLFRYSGLGSYSLVPSVATNPPNLFSLSSSVSSGWSGLYSAVLALPPGLAQMQMQLTISDRPGLQNQVMSTLSIAEVHFQTFQNSCHLQSCVVRSWISDLLLLEAHKPDSSASVVIGEVSAQMFC